LKVRAVSDAPSAKAVAAALTEAIRTNDADGLHGIYAPDAVIWHSTDQAEVSVDQLQGLMRAISRVATGEVRVKALFETAGGFVQTQENTYTFAGGETTTFHAALVAWLGPDGRVTRLEEYLDGAGLAPLIAALESP
jgi:hypothetical protein